MRAPDELAKIRRARRIWVWPTLAAMTIVTVAGNLAQAQHSIGGYTMHALPPLAYLVLVHILALGLLDGVWAAGVYAALAVLSAIAFFLSFLTLRSAAVRFGAEPGQAWLYPILVDVTVLAMTATLFGTLERMGEIEFGPKPKPEPNKGGRPKQAGSRRETVKVRAELAEQVEQHPELFDRTEQPEIEQAPKHTPNSERLFGQFGSDPERWPNVTELAEQFGCSKSTASNAIKRGRTIAEFLARTAPA